MTTNSFSFIQVNFDDFLKELEAANLMVANITTAAQGQAVDSALFTAARPMMETVKREVQFRTGRLYSGVTRTRLPIKRAGEIARVGITVKNRHGFKYVASRWHLEEFGFKHRKKPLKPYFTPAFKRDLRTFHTQFQTALSKNLSKAARQKLRISKRWSPESENNSAD